MAGRPSEFTQDKADYICQELAEGRSLRAICKDDGMPSAGTVCRWLSESTTFQQQYARAREAQADALFEEVLDIADEECTTVRADKHGTKDDDGDGNTEVVFDNVAVQRNRLRVDARKWMAGKLRPKKYGEKLEIAGDPDAPVKIETIQRVIVDPAK
jgi:hypothetical protein